MEKPTTVLPRSPSELRRAHLLAALGLLWGGCGGGCAPTPEQSHAPTGVGTFPCTSANHCQWVGDVPTCEAGYVRIHPNSNSDLRCASTSCVAENDAALCARIAKNCGSVSATDNCGTPRSVNCGSCTGNESCGGGGLTKVCGVPADCDYGPAQGLSDPCCPIHGIDACGAELFCAAFDGRTVFTCYPDGVRSAGESCLEDVHCAGGACSTVGSCKSMPGESCTAEVGCSNPDADEIWVCSRENSHCVPGGKSIDAACSEDVVCASGHCVYSHCTAGSEGAACQDHDDCDSGRCDASAHVCLLPACSTNTECDSDGGCVNGLCTHGSENDPCDDNNDCAAPLACRNGVCRWGVPGEACTYDWECAGGCYEGGCVASGLNEACDSSPDCGLASCEENLCRMPCAGDLECLFLGLAQGLVLNCREGHCVEVRELYGACTIDGDCWMGLVCSAEYTCLLDQAAVCHTNAECNSGTCTANDTRRCRSLGDGTYSNICTDYDDCNEYQTCADAGEGNCE